jgi:PIN domain nuclease of toxin-antitoxin system
MKLLIDTAALIWFLRKDEEISARAAGAIEDSRNQVYVSAAALWEISVKAATGALVAPEGLGETLSQDLEEAGFRILPIEGRHAEEVYRLPRVHPDPFDRLMIAQCRCEKMTAVTNDGSWSDRRYEIATVWK